MGYTIVRVVLPDGRKFEQAVIDSGWLARVRGLSDVPFSEGEISEIIPTHEKRDWQESP